MENENLQKLMQMLGITGGLGTAGAGFAGLFGSGKNPSDAANRYLTQIPGQTKPYYSPYMDAGKGAMESLLNENKDLLSGNKQNQLGANYKESPGYRFALEQALNSGANAQARGGMLGTPQDQAESQRTATGLASQDYNNYLQNQMGLYNTGYNGTQDFNHQGYSANTDYANMLGNNLSQQGNLAYAGQAGRNAQKSQGLGNIFSGLGMAGSWLLGGPAGGASMAWLSKLFGG